MKKSLVLLFGCLFMCITYTFAQETSKMQQPDLHTTDFFDPTAKKTVEPYTFSTEWRLEAGYVQYDEQEQDTTTHYQHGIRLGGTVDFKLPHRFSIQTGLLATFTYGNNAQHWRSNDEEHTQVEIISHHNLQLQLSIPVRAHYSIKLWKELNMFFYAGPQLQLGITHYDLIKTDISTQQQEWLDNGGINTESHDRYTTNERYRTNIQFGLGGGFEWGKYRIQAGYDFGLNNLTKTPIIPSHHSKEWGWMTTFSYKL